MTTKSELTAEGWAKHEAHGHLAAPLTDEERNLEGIREAEAQQSTGTATRRGGHIKGGISLPISSDALDALKRLKSGEQGVVQLVSTVLHLRPTTKSMTPYRNTSGYSYLDY